MQLSKEDADRYEIKEGDMIEVESRRGKVSKQPHYKYAAVRVAKMSEKKSSGP